MDKLDQPVIAFRAEGERLEQELKQIRSAITALQGASSNSRGTASRAGRTISAAENRSGAEGTLGRSGEGHNGRKRRDVSVADGVLGPIRQSEYLPRPVPGRNLIPPRGRRFFLAQAEL